MKVPPMNIFSVLCKGEPKTLEEIRALRKKRNKVKYGIVQGKPLHWLINCYVCSILFATDN